MVPMITPKFAQTNGIKSQVVHTTNLAPIRKEKKIFTKSSKLPMFLYGATDLIAIFVALECFLMS